MKKIKNIKFRGMTLILEVRKLVPSQQHFSLKVQGLGKKLASGSLLMITAVKVANNSDLLRYFWFSFWHRNLGEKIEKYISHTI